MKIHTIPNGLDVQQFEFTAKEYRCNLAFMGGLNHKKGIMLLIHAFWYLLRHSGLLPASCTLYIGGMVNDKRFKLYVDAIIEQLNISDLIKFDGLIKDKNKWFADKHYILCTSPWESQNMSVMEGMACGLKPVIHYFPGCEKIYKPEWVWRNIDQFVDVITGPYNPTEYREYVESRYSLPEQVDKHQEIIDANQ